MANIADVGGGLTAKEIQDRYLATIKANSGTMSVYGKTNTAINNAVSPTGPIGDLKQTLASQSPTPTQTPLNNAISTSSNSAQPTQIAPVSAPQLASYQPSPQLQQLSAAPNLNNINTPQYQAPKDDGINIMSYIDQLSKAQQTARMADLQKARDSSLSNLNAEGAKIDPQYNNLRSQTSTSSQLGAKSFAEFMAARGQTNSGVAGQSELNRNMQLQNDIGGLNLQQQNANNDIARRITDVNNGYNSDVTSANADIEAQKFLKYIEQTNTDRARADLQAQNSFQNAMASANFDMDKAYRTFTMDLQAKGFNNDQIQRQWENNFQVTQANNQNTQQQFNNTMDLNKFDYTKLRDAISDTRYNTEYADNRSDVKFNQNLQTRQLNNQETQQVFDNALSQANFDETKAQNAFTRDMQLKGYTAQQAQQAWENNFNSTKYKADQAQRVFENALSTNQFNETKSQNAFIRDMQTKGFNSDQAQRLWDNAYKTKQFEQAVAEGKLAQSNWQTEMTFKQAQAKIESALANKRISQETASQSLQMLKFKADQDPNSLDNLYKRAQIDALNSKTAKGPDYNYKDDASFKLTYAAGIKDPSGSLTKLKADPTKFIDAFGIDGYKALITASTPAGASSADLIAEILKGVN